MTYPLSDKDCPVDESGNVYQHGLELNVFCDAEMEAGTVDRITYFKKNENSCTDVLRMYSKNACPVFDV